MQKTKSIILLASMLILSGCANNNGVTQNNNNNNNAKTQSVSDDYISGALNNNQSDNSANAPDNQNNNSTMDNVKQFQFTEIDTNLGKIKVKLDAQNAPLTVQNFLKLAGEKFYDGTKFHRVIKGFMIQGGDPNSKTSDVSTWGMGGPGYTIPAEIKLKNIKGALATARLGDQINPKKESSGSQFFINTVDNPFLDGNYTVFGEVVEGIDTVVKIENVKTLSGDRPVEDVVIKNITPLEK